MNKDQILANLGIANFYQTQIPFLKINGSPNAMGLCPFHDDHNPSLSVNTETGLFKCFSCGEKGDIFTFYMKLHGVDFPTALREIGVMAGVFDITTKPEVVATFEYRDKNDRILYIKQRLEPGRNGRRKEFVFKHREDNKWVMGRGCAPVLYRLPMVINSKYCFVVEGEAKADLLNSWGLVATCLDSGANSPVKDVYIQILGGLDKVIILPDNDIPGKQYAGKIASTLNDNVSTLKIVELPELKEAEDVIDWARIAGNNKEKLLEIVENTPEWTPCKEGMDILSKLERWDYIQRLDIKVEWIVDKLIPKEAITVIFGKGGMGKTWLVMDIARCIGNGIHFLEHNTIKTTVVFVDFENPMAVLNTRTQRLGNAEDVYFWRACNDKLKAPKLDSKDWELYKSLPQGSVLIIDTLRASQSRDENASNDMASVMGRLKELRDMGFTIILLHHTAKNSDKVAKGSTAIVDLADHILGLTLVKKQSNGQDIVIDDEDDNDEDALYRFGTRDKTRFEPYHTYLTLNPDRGFELAPDPQEDSLRRMHAILSEHKTIVKTTFVDTCKKALGIGRDRVRKLLSRGVGYYWNITPDRYNKNTHYVEFLQLASLQVLYSAANSQTGKNVPEAPEELVKQECLKSLENTEFAKFADGCLANSQTGLPVCGTDTKKHDDVQQAEGGQKTVSVEPITLDDFEVEDIQWSTKS